MAPRVRTIREAVAHFKALDPATAISENALRRAIKRGEVPFVDVGNRQLVALESVERYCSGNLHSAEAGQAQREIPLRRFG